MLELRFAAKRSEAIVEVPDDARVLDGYESAAGNAVHVGYAMRHDLERQIILLSRREMRHLEMHITWVLLLLHDGLANETAWESQLWVASCTAS